MAMASRFELVLQGEDEVWLRAAGEEALSEIQRLDAQLTIYSQSSELSRVNALAADSPVRVEPRLFALLETARRLHDETDGAFDVTVAPLMRAWGFFRGDGHVPTDQELERARSVTGMHLVELDAANHSVRFARPGVMIDLGGIGKGYAIDEAVGILREAGVDRAFVHGGTSTSYGLGSPMEMDTWRVGIEAPSSPAATDEALAIARLTDACLSVSAVWGRSFEAQGETFGHVLDPREGRPVEGAALTAVVCASATEADALSTALLVLGRRGETLLHRLRGSVRALLLFPSSETGSYHVIEAGLSSIPSNRRHATALW